jgi:archaellum biogenesis ATPase FlaH
MQAKYNTDVQKFLISFLLSNPDAFARCQAILNPVYFEGRFRKSVRYLLDHAQEYRKVPLHEDVNAQFQLDFEKIYTDDERDIKAFLDTVESFCRHKAIEAVIHSGPEMLEKDEYGDLEKKIKEALLISLQNDLGTDYLSNPKQRLLSLRDRNNMVSTGWRDIDQKLYGGLNRGEITLFAGSSGAGKSLFLQNISLNWLSMGLNVIYITCELSEALTAMRVDSMLTGMSTKELLRKLDDVELTVKLKTKNYGRLQIKYLPPGTTSNGIKAYMKEFEIQTNIKPDALIVDYLDLLYPNNNRINPTDLFVKDKFVTEELRALAVESNVLCVSASQLNRSAVQEMDHDQSMIAGGLSKINTADNVLTIYTSDAMRQRGEYRLQFLKTRSSSGVGSKINLSFDIASLRIFNAEQGEVNSNDDRNKSSPVSTSLGLNRTSVRVDAKLENSNSMDENAPKTDTVKHFTGLKDIMNKIKS